MAHATHTELGTVVSLWRYPVKSMLGEELHTAQVQDHGLLGDRAYAILDSTDGKAATAKNPRKWPHLFAFRATYIEPSGSDALMPWVRITLPDGTSMTSEHSAINQVLSKALNRQVTLATTARGPVTSAPSSEPAAWTVQAEEYWPDIDGLCGRCVMTILAQGDLLPDSGILCTAVQQTQGHVGVYAAVVQGGTTRRSDRVRLVD